MSVIGPQLEADTLVLTRGRDFKWSFENLDASGQPVNFPAGTLFFEFDTSPKTLWDFVIDGSLATIKVESEDADAIPARTKWQLVFLPDGEAGGGDPIALGTVQVQG
ncbi:hypothetical protein PBI_PHANTASTIC_3 [Mycobacterium phage Phantastic]|uniref:LtfC/p132/Gp6 beta-sandwich domain-containing protein n=1 Tax=Mycobacterium phage Phantastic TaxID=1486426 RepID=A0A023W7C1_9CAUD|nr:hypothetical protein FH39_gp03 [Mycobacterium phage Phantastic]AHY27067.1 hypothetical protein PBI_PHANTASTIC_3 [Mycobacterium phage Phantastic]